MRASSFVSVVLAMACAARPAQADEKAACLDASLKAQTLRDGHKLVAAREQLRVCAQQGCPAAVQRDCATWLDAVERSLPTVVLSATDRKGASVVEVKVSVDGAPLASRIGGEAVAIDPGQHVFRFEFPGGVRVEQPVLVREGAQNQGVSAVEPAAPPEPAPPGPIAPPPAIAETPLPASAEAPGPSRWPAFASFGLGAAGLGVGAVAGALALSDASSAKSHCQGNACPSAARGDIDSSKTLATVSDVGFLVGAAGAAFGLGLLLALPSRSAASPSTAVHLVVTPTTVALAGSLP